MALHPRGACPLPPLRMVPLPPSLSLSLASLSRWFAMYARVFLRYLPLLHGRIVR